MRTQEFRLGAVTHEHMVAYGVSRSTSKLHEALAEGARKSGDRDVYQHHMAEARKFGHNSANLKKNAKVAPAGKVSYHHKTSAFRVGEN